MIDQEQTPVRAWDTRPTAKEKSAVHRSVTGLLDALAPERPVKRGENPALAVEQYRTLSGCILQAETAAVSVSFFNDTRVESLGELHVNVWKGVVSRGGSSYRKATTATMISGSVLHPTDESTEGVVWRDEDGRDFATEALAEHCRNLLSQQIRKSSR